MISSVASSSQDRVRFIQFSGEPKYVGIAGHRAAVREAGQGISGDSLPHATLVREALQYDYVQIIGDNDLLTNPVAKVGSAADKQWSAHRSFPLRC